MALQSIMIPLVGDVWESAHLPIADVVKISVVGLSAILSDVVASVRVAIVELASATMCSNTGDTNEILRDVVL